MLFRVIFNKLKDKFGEQVTYVIMFLPPVLIYIFSLRPYASGSTIFSNFIWLADCIIFGIPIGFFIAVSVGKKAGGIFGDAIYYPRKYLKVAPDIMSPIKGLLAREEYDEALEKLDELLEAKPFSPEPYLLLVETYANDLGDYLRAMTLIEEYFAQEKVHPFEENIDMLLLYADICGEHNYLHKAEKLLEQEITRKGYLEIKRKRLQTRLETIRKSLRPRK